MKKAFLGFMVLLVVGIISCSDSFDKISGSNDETEIPANFGRVVISLPKTGTQSLPNNENVNLSVARNITTAIENTNYFEAIFYRYKEDGTKYWESYRAEATLEKTSIELTVPIGTYDVLVLAGNRYSSTSYFSNYYDYEYVGNTRYYYSYPILLGSGYKENQNIAAGNNTVSITLLSVDYSITIPSTVQRATQYTVSVQFTLRNPLLWNRTSSVKAEIYYGSNYMVRGNNSEYDNIYGGYTYPALINNETAYTKTFTAPDVKNTSYSLNNYYSRLSPSGSSFNWYIFGKDIYPNYTRPNSIPASFTVVEDMGGIGVDLDWGNE